MSVTKRDFSATGKSDPFVTVKEGSEGREKFRTRTITNTLEPAWSETAIVAMPDVNGLLLLVRRISEVYCYNIVLAIQVAYEIYFDIDKVVG